jgi:ribosomal protein S18 acetylase RimI-like enzyme
MPQDFLDNIDVSEREKRWAEGFEKYPEQVNLVAVDENGNVLGFVSGNENREDNPEIDGELWAIYIHPEKTHLGIGTKLFNVFKEKLISKDMKTMNVWVLGSNTKACKFYEKMGGVLSNKTKIETIAGVELPHVSYEYKLKDNEKI